MQQSGAYIPRAMYYPTFSGGTRVSIANVNAASALRATYASLFGGTCRSTANANLASTLVHTAFVINMAGRRAAVEESRRRCTPIRDDYAERAVQFTSYHCRPRERREGVVENQMAQIHKVWNKNLVEANNWIKLPFCRSLQWIPVSRI